MQTHHIERGLNDLSLYPQEPKRQDSDRRSVSTLMTPDSFLYRSSSFSAIIGDYIGMESCVDVLSDGDQLELLNRSHTPPPGEREIRGRRDRRSSETGNYKREFPPPIPSLAQTENMHSRMPWVLRRHYTGDGRLILTEEKVRHHEYFRAHRSNGRLTLHLVPLDGAVLGASLADKEIIENECNNVEDRDNQEHNDQDLDDKDDGGDDVNCGELDGGDEVEEEDQCNHKNDNGNIQEQGIGSCCNYSSGRCILGVAVPAIRPVHT